MSKYIRDWGEGDSWSRSETHLGEDEQLSLHEYIRDHYAGKALDQEVRLTWGRMNCSASTSKSETTEQGRLLVTK